MIKNIKSNVETQPKFLWFIIVSYTMITVMSNWFDFRLIDFFGLTVLPGAIIFPLNFLISDIITEAYGYKKARLAIWTAFLFNLMFLFYGQMITYLPSPAFAAHNNALFDKILAVNFFVMMGSFLSYLVSEPLNAYIVSKLKIKFNGKLMGIRFITSTVIASFFDSIIFTTVAFGHVYDTYHVIQIMFSIWITKVVVEILVVPISVRLTKIIKIKEHVDMYDYDTSFNLFSLDSEYAAQNNKFDNNQK